MQSRLVVAMASLCVLAGCGTADVGGGASAMPTPDDASAGGAVTASASPTPSATPASGEGGAPTVSPSALPTLKAPTTPPSAPTDLVPSDTVAGRVTAVSAGCVDVVTDDGVVWSLAGDTGADARVGATVTAKVADAGGAASCGEGRAAALVSLRVVG